MNPIKKFAVKFHEGGLLGIVLVIGSAIFGLLKKFKSTTKKSD